MKTFFPLQMPLHGLNLKLDTAPLRGKVKDLIMHLHNQLKRVGLKTGNRS